MYIVYQWPTSSGIQRSLLACFTYRKPCVTSVGWCDFVFLKAGLKYSINKCMFFLCFFSSCWGLVIVNYIYLCIMRTFFPLKIPQKFEVRIIHMRALCKGKYGNGLVAPLFSIFYVIHEFDGILHRGWASSRGSVGQCAAFGVRGPRFDPRWLERLLWLSSDPCSNSFNYPLNGALTDGGGLEAHRRLPLIPVS